MPLVSSSAETTVSTTNALDANAPTPVLLAGGGYLVYWIDGWDNVGGVATRGRVYDANGSAVGTDFVLSPTSQNPEVTALSNGGFVAAWSPSGSNRDVVAQLFSSTGTTVGSQISVNTTTAGSQDIASVTALQGGGFVVVYQSDAANDVRGQVFTNAGAPTGSEFTITPSAGQAFTGDVAALPSGGFVVAFSDNSLTGGDASGFAARAQVFTAGGVAIGSPFLVNTTTANSQTATDVTVLANGNYVVFWQDFATSGMRGQVFTGTDGTKVGSEFTVETTPDNLSQNELFAVALDDGGFVVTWNEQVTSGTGGDLSGKSVKAQLFTAGGVKSGGEILVNTSTAGDQWFPGIDAPIAKLANGGFVIVWTDFGPAGNDPVVNAQLFNADGTRDGGEFMVNTTTTSFQANAGVAARGNGFVVTWADFNGVDTARSKTFLVAIPPSLGGAGGTTGYAENAAATAVTSGLTVSDSDSTTLTGATVSISGGFHAGEDVLAFTNQNGITGSYNATTGVLTLTGTATLAQYQAALRSVTYANSSEAPDTTSRTVSFVVTDGLTSATAATQTVTVSALNDVPVLGGAGGTLAFTENGAAAAVASGLTLADPDNANLSGATVSITGGFHATEDVLGFTNQNGITGSYNAATGVLTLTGSATLAQYQAALRSVTYVNSSDAPATGSRTVSFVATDGTGNATAATQTVTITAVNDAPVLAGAGGSTGYTENGAGVAVASGLALADPDNASMASATVSITGGFHTGEDALGFTNQNGITGSYNAATGVLTLSGSATLAQYQAALRSVTYSNNAEAPDTTARTISFVVNDGAANALAVTQTVTVGSVNDAPVLAGAAGTTGYTENGAGVAIASGLTVADPDNASLTGATVSITGGFQAGQDALGFAAQNGIIGSYNATTGVLTLTGSATLAQYQAALRSVTYSNGSEAPNTGARTISFVVNDGTTNATAATQTVTVSAVNDAPSGHDATLSILQDGTKVFAASDFGFSDIDGHSLSAVKITTLPGAGTLTDHGVAVTAGQLISLAHLTAGDLVFTPGAGQSGNGYATLTFQVEDSGGVANGGIDLDPTPNTLTINVSPPPPPPPPSPPPPPPPVGTAGSDVVTLQPGSQRFDAGAGDDDVTGSFFADSISGGAGADTVHGDYGDDSISGGPGSSYLRGDEGDDWIEGGDDFDDAHGNIGNDTVHGWGGDDWVVGGKGDDTLFGDAGGDIVYGNLGNDTCSGGDGADLVRGGQANDVLDGGAGDDWLSGDRGDDTLTGGVGRDTFHTWNEAGLDRVLDFHAAEGDRVQVDAGSAYTLAQVGADTVIDFGNGNQMVLVGVQLSSLPPSWIFVA